MEQSELSQNNHLKQTHTFPLSTFSVTILFTLLMSDIWHEFRYSVQICHSLYNVTNKQTNKFPPHHPISNSSVHCADV